MLAGTQEVEEGGEEVAGVGRKVMIDPEEFTGWFSSCGRISGDRGGSSALSS